MNIRNCNNSDIPHITKIIDECGNYDFLTRHTDFTYALLMTYFSDFCFVLERDSNIIGFIHGFVSSDPSIAYLWQIGISPAFQNQGHSEKLIAHFVMSAKKFKCKEVQFSLESSNKISKSAFQSFADKNNLKMIRKENLDIIFEKSNKQGTAIDTVYSFTL